MNEQKQSKFIIDVSAPAKWPNRSTTRFFSYDSHTAEIVIQAENDGKLIDQTLVDTVDIYFESVNMEYRPIDGLKWNDTMEIGTDGLYSYILPDDFLNYEGLVAFDVYINYKNGDKADSSNRIIFEQRVSAIDRNAGQVELVYIKDMEIAKREITEQATEITENFLREWNAFEAGSTAKMQELEQRIDEQTEIFNNADVYNKAEIEDKLEPFALRTDIAEVSTQLAQKVGLGKKAELEDLSADVLSAIEGGEGTEFNLMSIPQDYSVTPEKTTFIQLSENRDRFLDKRINLNTYINPKTGVKSYHETFAVSEFIAVEPLTSYIFWWDDTKNIASVQSKVYYDENKVFIIGEYGGNPITTPANCAFMRIEINKATSFDNLIMQKGSTKSENIPNPKLKDIDVDINSDNLPIGIDNLTFIIEPVNKDIFLDKKIYLNTYINPTVGTPSNHATFASSEYIEVEPETTYRFSLLDGTTGGFGGVVFYDQNKNYIDGQYSGSPFTSPAGCHYVRVSVNDATTFDDVILQKGEEPSLPINDKITTAFKTDEGYFNKKWAVVGDSITEKNFRAKIHYHDYIRAELGLKVVNMGVSGSGYKEREDSNNAFYQRVSNIPTDVNFITIMGGVNDVLTSQPLGEVTDSTTDTVCGCINKTIDNIYDTHPLAQIGLITPVPGADYNPANTNNGLALLSEKIIEIAKLRGLPSMDLYHSSGLRPWNSVVNKALFSTTESPDGDGLHPNDEGHKFFYRKIMEFIKSL